MFERTFSFWRTMIGEPTAGQTATGTATSTADERRLWLRYPADLETSILLPDSALRDTLRATIRDISRGGANLTVDREVPPGQLLNLDLPRGADESVYTVLACVVRAQRKSDGQWALGCVFSRELTDEDLLGFGARRVRHDPADHRQWVRFDCNLHARYQPIGAPGEPVEALQVLNLSAS